MTGIITWAETGIIVPMNSDENKRPASAVPTRREGFVLEELDGDLLLFNPQNGRLLELNSTAALIWQLCDGTRALSDIEALLAELYPGAAPAITAELPAVLHRLEELGALSWKIE